MNTPDSQLLVCTNGAQEGRAGLEFGVHLAQSLERPVRLLGVMERGRKASAVKNLLEEFAEKLGEAQVPFEVESQKGQAEEVIPAAAQSGRYLTVVGRLGRPLWHQWVLGRSFRSLLSDLASPLLYVPNLCWPLRQILVCTGGLEYPSSLEQLSLWLASAAQAQVTLLHVVVPVNLDYPLAHRVQQNWHRLAETDTPPGRTLRRGLELAQQAGVAAEVKVRCGSVVNEIMAEMHSRPYDLIALGSPYSTHSLRHLYLPNVTAEVAETVRCPVLTVRASYEI